MSDYDPPLSMVESATATRCRPTRAAKVFHAIRSGKWRKRIEAIRKLDDPKKRGAAKKRLPGILWSGLFEKRENNGLVAPSGLICIDLDHLETPEETRERIKASPHLWGIFTSPSGDGLKCVFRCPSPPMPHMEVWRIAAAHVKALAGAEADKAAKDVARLCFASWDPEAFHNPNSQPLIPAVPAKGERPPARADPPRVSMTDRRRIAEDSLGAVDWTDDSTGLCECPGKASHTTQDGKRDCRVQLEGAPTVHCFHSSCSSEVAGANRELRSRIAKAEMPAPSARPGRSPPPDNVNALQSTINDARPKVFLPGDSRMLSDFAADLGDVLREKDIFTRDSIVCTIDSTSKRLTEMSDGAFQTWPEQFFVPMKSRKIPGEPTQAVALARSMPVSVAHAALRSPQLIRKLRPLAALHPVRFPVSRADGSIELLPIGYDAESKIYTLESDVKIERMKLESAVAVIRNLWSEFPFREGDQERSLSVAISSMFTLYARMILPPQTARPAYIYTANDSGAGKTLSVMVAAVPILGECETNTRPRDEDETRKLLASTVLAASPFLLLDNWRGKIQSPSLEAFLTSPTFSGRVLGQSTKFTAENIATVFITGNQGIVTSDMRRRSLVVEYFIEEERAENRRIDHPLNTRELLNMRETILSALWTMIVAWHEAGQPRSRFANRTFEEWSEIVGGIMEQCGFCSPVIEPTGAEYGDTELEDMKELLESLARHPLPQTFAELCQICADNGLLDDYVNSEGVVDPSTRARFGKLLQRYAGRWIGAHRFRIKGKGRNRTYEAETHPEATEDRHD